MGLIVRNTHWIQSKRLASKILSRVARQLPIDWLERYGFRPVLPETFVEFERHKGTCYKAANWIHMGRTVGPGKKSSSHLQLIPVKDIWLYPLRRDFANILCLQGNEFPNSYNVTSEDEPKSLINNDFYLC